MASKGTIGGSGVRRLRRWRSRRHPVMDWPRSSGLPEQVVGGTYKVGGHLVPFSAAITRLSEVPNGLAPAEDLLDPLPDALA
jgi:hypothetical protein